MSKRSCCGAVRILLSLGEPFAEIVRVEALSLRRRAILLLAKWPLGVVSWFARLLSQSRGRGFDSPLVRGSSGLKIAVLSTNVVRGACSCSSGWKIATFKYRRSMRSTLPQLRLENRNFKYKNSTRSTFPQLRQHLCRATCAESLAQSACAEQLAQSTCAEQLAQSTCAEQLAQSTCVQQPGTMQLAQTTFVRNRAAQLVQSTWCRADSCRANLHRASCAEPLEK